MVYFVVLCVTIFSACSQMGAQYGIKPDVQYDIRGEVRDGVYTSIGGTYQIRIPPLLKPGAVIRDKKISDNVTMLSLSDDLCREYFVVQTFLHPKESFEEHAESIVTAAAVKTKATILERKKVNTSVGSGFLYLLTFPQGAPCVQVTFVEGKRKDAHPDATQAILIIQSTARVYHFGYTLGPLDEFGIKTGPAEEKLMELVGGFKQLK